MSEKLEKALAFPSLGCQVCHIQNICFQLVTIYTKKQLVLYSFVTVYS